MIRIFFFTFASILMLWSFGSAEKAGMSKMDKLRSKPYTDSKVLLLLQKNQKVDIQKRQGAWYSVKTGKRAGWVPMFSVRRTQQPAVATKGSLSSVSTGRTSSGNIVTTTGVRGMDEEKLNTTVFSETAVAAAEKYRITAADAIAYATECGLKTHNVPALVAPRTVVGVKK